MSFFVKNCRKFLTEDVKKLRIAVIGDVMLDQYYYGEVSRISPEAPVPINHVRKIKSVLGGASNVVSNLANLGCTVFLGSVCGNDVNHDVLRELLQREKIDCSGLVSSDCRPTTTKARVLGMGQQMMRLDFEETDDLHETELKSLQAWFLSLLDTGIDGILLSDYAKGVCSTTFCSWIISKARERNIPVLVDPKGKNWSKYMGCNFITPNVKEVSDVLGYKVKNEEEEIVSASYEIKEKYFISNIIVTRSEKGITMVGNEVLHSPATATEVFDVTGCGDTVAAVILASCICGLSYKEALQLANYAAGVVITKVGTYPIHREELLQVIADGK